MEITNAMDSQDKNRPRPDSYADEVLCANWHPLVALLADRRSSAGRRGQADTPATIEVEGFLARLYASQQA